MAAQNAARPVPAVADDEPRNLDRFGEPITCEDNASLKERQARRLARRFRLTWPVARLVAAHHFGGGAA